MDIYIGGVLDRNASLNGDVVAVELYPPSCWKVLYSALDEYLEDNPSLRARLINTHTHTHTHTNTHTDTHTVTHTNMHTDTHTDTHTNTHTNTHTDTHTNTHTDTHTNTHTYTHTHTDTHTHTGTSTHAHTDNPTLTHTYTHTPTHTHAHTTTTTTTTATTTATAAATAATTCKLDVHSDNDSVVIEEEEEDKMKELKKRRRRGRGRKKGRRKEDKEGRGGGGRGRIQGVEGGGGEGGGFHDSLILLPNQSSNITFLRPYEEEKEDEEEYKGASISFAVPPDELSECQSSDEDSVASEIVDYEQCQEDQAFFDAQFHCYSGTGGGRGTSASSAGSRGATTTRPTSHMPPVPRKSAKIKHMPQCKQQNSPTSQDGIKEVVAESIDQDSISNCLEGISISAKGHTRLLEGPQVPIQPKESAGMMPNIPCKQRNSPDEGDGTKGCVDGRGVDWSIREENRGEGGGIGRGGRGIQRGGRGGLGHTQQQNPNNNNNNQHRQRTQPTVLQIQQVLDNWDRFVQRTARVVYIVQHKHPRLAAGTLKRFPDGNTAYGLFAPSDHRVPRMKIPSAQLPRDFCRRQSADIFKNRLYLCRIAQWTEPKYALGELVEELGMAGDIEVETRALLLENCVKDEEFPREVLRDLPPQPWTIPPQELSHRTDLRHHCILTIDPASARDLDDAISCRTLPSGDLEVGVHIADVGFFVPEGGRLDKEARERGTSVYLTEKVIPMLPRDLCDGLCSLLPGLDRLTFSVVWVMTPDGRVKSEWFGRTVIRSCVKLTYEHAQEIIDTPGQMLFDFPAVYPPHTTWDVFNVITNLHRVTKSMRERRFASGALQIQQSKLTFALDPNSHRPAALALEHLDKQDSHHLIEELMLLANMAAAERIWTYFPNHCVLRRHPPPITGQMETVVRTLETLGVYLDASTAGTLYKTMQRYQGHVSLAISCLCSRPMQNARYFTPVDVEKLDDHRHYALNVPRYTHFTSPIRRYPDILVHRLLAATLSTSLGNTVSSPGNAVISPGNTLTNFGNTVTIPDNTATSLHNTTTSLGNTATSHDNILTSFGNTVTNPDNTANDLGNTATSPGNTTTNLRNTAPTLHNPGNPSPTLCNTAPTLPPHTLSLGNTSPTLRKTAPTLPPHTLSHICDHCNERKKAAKTVQEASAELHLALLVSTLGEIQQPALAVQILDRSFDALLYNLGVVRRVYTDQLPLQTPVVYRKERNKGTLVLSWRPIDGTIHGSATVDGSAKLTQVIELLTEVTVVLKPTDKAPLRFQTCLVRPT